MESPIGLASDDWKTTARAALCSLYLPGAPCPNLSQRRLGWPKVVAALRSREAPYQAINKAGLWQEASLLADPVLMGWGHTQAERALTVLDETYPARWLARLGAAAPPCLALSGAFNRYTRPWIGVVGSREPNSETADLARALGVQLARSGAVVVSGGARGIDSLAIAGAVSSGGAAVEILPSGLRRAHVARGAMALLSVAADGAEFSAACAKQRNSLVFAGAQAVLVLGPQFKAGGTWAAAVEALRRRLTTVVVPANYDKSQYAVAYRALINLGAEPLCTTLSLTELLPSLLGLAARQKPPQPGLFGYDEVRESSAAYLA